MSSLALLALTLTLSAQEPPPPAAPATDPSSAPIDPAAVEPPESEAPAASLEDPLVTCKQLVADKKLDVAERCFRERAAEGSSRRSAGAIPAAGSPGFADGVHALDAHTERALAMADVVAAWRLLPPAAAAAAAPPSTTATPVGEVRSQVSLTGLVTNGTAEAVLHGAVGGGFVGFLSAGALFSTTRTSEQESLPWLLAAPAIGAVSGAAGTYALLVQTEPNAGDIAFTASTTWSGFAEGMLLQLAVFDGNVDVSAVPLRFVTILGGGALGLGAGIFLSPLVDVTQGDTAVANSALFWGGAMTGFGLAVGAAAGTQLTVPVVTLSLLAGSLVPYSAVLVAHPYLNIERWPSWLIEAGGAAGFLVAGALVTVAGANGAFSNGVAPISLLAAGTLAGVSVGAGAAWFVSQGAPPAPSSDEPARDALTKAASFAPAPTVFIDDDGRAAPGFAVTGRF